MPILMVEFKKKQAKPMVIVNQFVFLPLKFPILGFIISISPPLKVTNIQ